MGVFDAVRSRARRFLERPGATVDLGWVRRLLPEIEQRGAALTEMTDAALRAAAVRFRDAGIERVDAAAVVEASALAREAAVRALGQRLYDSQILAAAAMMSGQVAQLATGEGKTLAAVPAVLGLAARGLPVHVLTVNDYLARRDAEWMAPAYELLGLRAGWVAESSEPVQRRDAYGCAVTYGSISEVGFDFLRDQLVTDPADRVQRELAAVLVDEADSILVDEARIPMVLAGGAPAGNPGLRAATRAVAGLVDGRDYTLATDHRTVHLTDGGLRRVERELDADLYAADRVELLTAVNLALSAAVLLRRDVEYLVRDGRVELVDEFRGRVARRRRWPDGLHAAVEVKEGLAGTESGEVLNTLTVQAFVRLYQVRAGMTATAVGVGENLRTFYGLEVAVIDPHRPCVRDDLPDRVYVTRRDKEAALIEAVGDAHALGRPVLLGTQDVAESERIAAALRDRGIDSAVLNARNDRAEAAIVGEAGAPGAVTVSTQMAGRGTDIRLGGSDAGDAAARVAELGGLLVLGCGRHESGRVDDQLRGRAGRQGDPGESVFFVSLEDDLVVENAPDVVPADPRSDPSGLIFEAGIRRVVDHAQRVAEGVNYAVHRETWKYHQVIELQRQELAADRDRWLTTDAAAELLREARPERYAQLRELLGEPAVARISRLIVLQHADDCWAAHLGYLGEVREGIHLRALGREVPLDEFHRLAVRAFGTLRERIVERGVAMFADADITGGDWTPAAAGLNRPAATWTYLTSDDPFGSELERILRRHGHDRRPPR
ncbi:accessory Sec system translocase SecA2 [Actinocatenispora sera]|uniref:accessory Sec system translocase SecA2 n=1 Tax=Actinocatenispora sera TaxID=390989 RepID=UPI000691E81E|nr:accessory Sec system translocase SecA2 [Actinocatenispora sera]